jgi:hypothetical protein
MARTFTGTRQLTSIRILLPMIVKPTRAANVSPVRLATHDWPDELTQPKPWTVFLKDERTSTK